MLFWQKNSTLLPEDQDMLPSETVSSHSLCSPLELAMNSAGTRCLSQASHLSVVVKSFSGFFPSLCPISAIKPQAQGPGFCYIFSFCLNQTPFFPENSIVQEVYKVLNKYVADTCGLWFEWLSFQYSLNPGQGRRSREGMDESPLYWFLWAANFGGGDIF